MSFATSASLTRNSLIYNILTNEYRVDEFNITIFIVCYFILSKVAYDSGLDMKIVQRHTELS